MDFVNVVVRSYVQSGDDAGLVLRGCEENDGKVLLLLDFRVEHETIAVWQGSIDWGDMEFVVLKDGESVALGGCMGDGDKVISKVVYIYNKY